MPTPMVALAVTPVAGQGADCLNWATAAAERGILATAVAVKNNVDKQINCNKYIF